jgi:hypothetical protein
MKYLKLTLLVILPLALASAIHSEETKRKASIVRQIARILIESGDPKILFDLFSEEFQLPVAWPLEENRGYLSGGLGAGNVNIEVYRYGQQKLVPARKDTRAHYSGLALEPYPLPEALRELREIGIPYSPPEPYTSTLPNGSQGVLWTTVPLPSFSRPGMSIYLYEYSPAFLQVNIRRNQLGNRLTLNNGGPLGFLAVREIVIASADFERDKAAWTRLLGAPTAPGTWSAGVGPAIRLIPESRDFIQKIVIQVKSLDRAKTFLKKKRLLGRASAREIALKPSRIQSLNISLME